MGNVSLHVLGGIKMDFLRTILICSKCKNDLDPCGKLKAGNLVSTCKKCGTDNILQLSPTCDFCDSRAEHVEGYMTPEFKHGNLLRCDKHKICEPNCESASIKDGTVVAPCHKCGIDCVLSKHVSSNAAYVTVSDRPLYHQYKIKLKSAGLRNYTASNYITKSKCKGCGKVISGEIAICNFCGYMKMDLFLTCVVISVVLILIGIFFCDNGFWRWLWIIISLISASLAVGMMSKSRKIKNRKSTPSPYIKNASNAKSED
jgi:hypothetical protein